MKNSTIKKLVAAILCILAVASSFSLAACTPQEPDNTKTGNQATGTAAQNTQTNESGVVDRADVKDGLPERNFEGETVTIYVRQDFDYEIWAEAETEELLNDAVYKRLNNIQERFNVKLESVVCGDKWSCIDKIAAIAQSGSDECDIAAITQYYSPTLILQNALANLHNTEYLDFSKPWWPDSYIKVNTYENEKLYFLAGDIGVAFIQWMNGIFFNRQIFEDKTSQSADTLYQLATDRKWTLDKLSEYCKLVYNDIDGGGERDENDLYGIGLAPNASLYAFLVGSNVEFSKFNADGYPEIVLNNSYTLEVVDKLRSFMYSNNGVYVGDTYKYDMDTHFAKSELMFLPGRLIEFAQYRSMDDDYGILPVPMYDEAQGEYKSFIHDSYNVFCVPTTCEDVEKSAFILEAMAAEGYRYITPAYYEIALKKAYARDDKMSQMLDIIRDTVSFDFALVNSNVLENIEWLIPFYVLKEGGSFASEYDKISAKLGTDLSGMIDTIKHLEP